MHRAVLSCVAALLALTGTLARATSSEELRALVQRGRAAAAYEAGKLQPGAPGDLEFDYYFGVAAIESGHAGEGVLALGRFLARNPGDDRARFDLARGYYALGELVRARDAFETVLAHRPDPEREATIERFLDSIQARAWRDEGASSLYVDAGGGFDSNISAGMGADSLEAPLLDGVLLTPGGPRHGRSFLLAAAGARFAQPLAGAASLEGGLRYEGRYQTSGFDRQFDNEALGGYGGLSFVRGQDLYRASISYAALAVDTSRYRNISALGGEWRHQLDELSAVSLFAQYAELAYPAAPTGDGELYALGAGWRYALVQRYQPVVQLQALFGREKNTSSPPRDDLTRDVYALRAGVSTTPWPRWGVSGALSYTASRFAAPDPSLAVTREDGWIGLDAGLSYRWSRQLTLRAEYLHTDNRSNLESYKYGRDVLTLRMHYDVR
jgi:outer membrane protein